MEPNLFMFWSDRIHAWVFPVLKGELRASLNDALKGSFMLVFEGDAHWYISPCDQLGE